jgi:ribosomal 30S subunit maturation factor RimM
VLVPLAEAICPVIDPAARRIVIDPPEGLLDLNG